MYIVKVTPFSKSVKKEVFSYFYPNRLESGTIVTVPLRNKSIKGLVIESEEANLSKAEIKTSEFSLKKIKSVSNQTIFNSSFLEAAKETADYFATSLGSVIETMVPKIIFENFDKLKFEKKKNETTANSNSDKLHSAKYAVQLPDQDRLSHYKSLIREKFARKQSVIFCVPTVEDTIIAEEHLKKGIEQSTFVFHNQKKKDSIVKEWKAVSQHEKPVLLVVTGKFLCVPRNDIGLIVLDRESSRAYRVQTRPYLDIRKFAEKFAEKNNSEIIFGDLMLRLDTLLRHERHELVENTPMKFRSLSEANQKIIDMKNRSPLKESSAIISYELEKLIKKTYEENKKIFLFTSRKGLSPIILCGDCGNLVKCTNCEAPVVLYSGAQDKNLNNRKATGIKKSHGNIFKCKVCGKTRPADENCEHCNSWRLQSLGIGTQTIQEEIQKLLPEIKIFLVDKETTTTTLQARKEIDKFYQSASAVLIGTEMALLYLYDEIENVAVVSTDALFSLPDFGVRERMFNMLLKARSKAKENFLIQTRNIDEVIFKNIIQGNLAEFYKEEFSAREDLDYPPFSLIIKLTASGRSKEKLADLFNSLSPQFSDQEFNVYDAFYEKVKGNFIMHAAFKVKREKWPNHEIIEKLRNLPPQIKIEVDTDSVL